MSCIHWCDQSTQKNTYQFLPLSHQPNSFQVGNKCFGHYTVALISAYRQYSKEKVVGIQGRLRNLKNNRCSKTKKEQEIGMDILNHTGLQKMYSGIPQKQPDHN